MVVVLHLIQLKDMGQADEDLVQVETHSPSMEGNIVCLVNE